MMVAAKAAKATTVDAVEELTSATIEMLTIGSILVHSDVVN